MLEKYERLYMTRGCKVGFVTKDTLAARLTTSVPGAFIDPKKTAAKVILGHATFYGLVTGLEIAETIETVETTVPCYLHTYVEDPLQRRAIEDYVMASSDLYFRGTVIANMLVMKAAGAIQAGAACPRFRSQLCGPLEGVVEMISGIDDPRSSDIKQVFLPERWPTKTVPRSANIQAVLDEEQAYLPRLPDWEAVMKPTGWDNVVNRMATKFVGNIKVHVVKNLKDAVMAYLEVATLCDEGSRGAVIDVVKGRIRPLAIGDDDMAMVLELRRILGARADDPTWHTPKQAPYSKDALKLHLFIVQHGVAQRAYLPVATKGRKYAYLDLKVASALFAEAKRKEAKRRREETTACGGKRRKGVGPSTAKAIEVEDGGLTDTTLGDLLGVTVSKFNRFRKKLRAKMRKQCRTEAAKGGLLPGKKRERLKRLARRWERNGYSKLPQGARVDSVETDGVGLRLCVKMPIDLKPYIVPISLPSEAAASSTQASACPPQRRVLKKKVLKASEFEAVDPADAEQPNPIVVALDNGRAKLFTAAISHQVCLSESFRCTSVTTEPT